MYKGWYIHVGRNRRTTCVCGAGGGEPGMYHYQIDNYELHVSEGAKSHVETRWNYHTPGQASLAAQEAIKEWELAHPKAEVNDEWMGGYPYE